MYRTIPEKQIKKAKRLLKQGHSLRSTEFLSGLSFTKVRQIYQDMNGVERVKKSETSFFDVGNICWVTGLRFWE